MSPQTVILIGPQGSGKGTQIEKLYARFKEIDTERRTVEIQSGGLFREFGKTEQGYTADHIRKTLDAGILQPLFLSIALWSRAFVRSLTSDCHLLIDGFPRTMEEAKVLDSALNFYRRDSLTVIFLDTPEEVVKERMRARARDDDTEESIEERLKWYRTDVLPVVEFYKKRENTKIINIDGTKTINEVFNAVCEGLGI